MATITIGNVDYSKYLVYPFKWSRLLDERLDEKRISLRFVPNKPVFSPGEEVVITSGNETIDYIIASDSSMENPPGSGNYSHELMLIEPTKILEGIAVETLTFKNSLGRTYTSNPVKVEPVYE